MFRLNPGQAVYLHRDAIDFRKNINGQPSLVEHGLGMDAFAHAVFVFGNRRKDRIKILGWERNGFWLLQKRLEGARFVWPSDGVAVTELTVAQLHWQLEGIDLAATHGHAPLQKNTGGTRRRYFTVDSSDLCLGCNPRVKLVGIPAGHAGTQIDWAHKLTRIDFAVQARP